jgi:hypothetical protein
MKNTTIVIKRKYLDYKLSIIPAENVREPPLRVDVEPLFILDIYASRF